MNEPEPSDTKSTWKKILSSMTILGILSAGSNSCAEEKVAEGTIEEDMSNVLQFQKQNKELVEELKSKGIESKSVLSALENIPRHLFVPESLINSSYDDNALPIGLKQTISQPYIVAYMTDCLGLEKTDNVLEIGTGSGYQAAVLSRLVKKVYSIELLEPLAVKAKKTLKELNIENVEIKIGDGYKGWPDYAPYDAIIVTAAPPEVPMLLVEQLKVGGLMIVPVGVKDVQWLVLIRKEKDRISQKQLIPVRFVPMVHGDTRN